MAGPLYSRREILAGGLAGAAWLSLAGTTSFSLGTSGRKLIHRAAKVRKAGSDLGAVEHVIFLMQENRSFDHYYGTMKGVAGFNDHPASSDGVFAQSWPDGKSSTLLPLHLDVKTTNAECTYDLSHSWQAEHSSWNGGKMDSFVSTHTSSEFEGSQGVVTMGYYESADIPFYFALADAFTICDNYFCSVLGPTHPNRLYWSSGTLDPAGVAGGPILVTNSDTSLQFSCSWKTMPEALTAKGVSWRVYNPYGSNYQPGGLEWVSNNPFLYFKQYSDPSSALYQNAFGYYGPTVSGGLTGGTSPNDFAKDVQNNELPSVSWIIAPDGYDEHPPAPPAFGEWYVSQILSILLSNTEVWSKTVLFISYDENDGFFDHVPPSTASTGTEGEYLTVSPLPSDAGGISGPIGMGVRVPLLVISPFSTGGYLNSDVFDHTSQLQFLGTLFDVEVPNLSSWRKSVTGDLTATLPHLSTADTKAPTLPTTSDSSTTPPVSTECSADNLIELNGSIKPYTVPKKQTMPTQQKGSLKPTPS